MFSLEASNADRNGNFSVLSCLMRTDDGLLNYVTWTDKGILVISLKASNADR